MTSPSEAATAHRIPQRGAAWRLFALGLGYCVAYVALSMLSDRVPIPWGPAAALTALAVVHYGWNAAPAVIIGAVAAEWAASNDATSAVDIVVMALISAATYFAAGLRIRTIQLAASGEPKVASMTRFLATVPAILAVGAALMTAYYAAMAGAALAVQRFLQVWIGDLLGIVVLLPWLTLIADFKRLRTLMPLPAMSLVRDLVLLVIADVAILWLIFGERPFDEFRTSYLLFLPVIAVALRHGHVGAVNATLLTQLALIVSIIVSKTRTASVFEYQLLMLTLTVTTLYVGILVSERMNSARVLASRESEARERQTMLNQALRLAAASEMASAMAHEINQPLSAIGTYANAARALLDTVPKETLPPQVIRASDVLEKIRRETARSGEIVSRIRDFYRQGASRFEPVRVEALFEGVRERIADRVQRGGVTLKLNIAPGLPLLWIDAVQIDGVLFNIATNALDALEHYAGARRLSLYARAAGEDRVVITVEDSGPGIAPEVRATLFQALATTKPSGMGLGLAMARTLVEAHGGKLWLAADARSGDVTTCFSFELPSYART